MKHLHLDMLGVSVDGTVSGEVWAGGPSGLKGLFIEPGKCQRHLPGPSNANPLNTHHARKVPGSTEGQPEGSCNGLWGRGSGVQETLLVTQRGGQALGKRTACCGLAHLGTGQERPLQGQEQCGAKHPCWQWNSGVPGTEH